MHSRARWTVLPATAMIVLMSSCGGGDGSIPGTWRIEGRLGLVGGRLIGTWTHDDPASRTVDRLALNEDGTWGWVKTWTSPTSKCTHTTTWSGRFTNDASLRVLRFAGADGTFIRSGCGSNDGRRSEPGLNGNVPYSTIGCLDACRFLGWHRLALSLSGLRPGSQPIPGSQPVDFGRVNIMNDSTLLTFNADMTWHRTTTRIYAADAARHAGCQEITTQSGRYSFGPGGTRWDLFDPPHQDQCSGHCWLDLAIGSEEAAMRTRTACAAPEDNGPSTEDAAASLGALAGATRGRVLSRSDSPDEFDMNLAIEGRHFTFAGSRQVGATGSSLTTRPQGGSVLLSDEDGQEGQPDG